MVIDELGSGSVAIRRDAQRVRSDAPGQKRRRQSECPQDEPIGPTIRRPNAVDGASQFGIHLGGLCSGRLKFGAISFSSARILWVQ